MGKILAGIIIIVAVFIGGYFWKHSSSGSSAVSDLQDTSAMSAGITYYYGAECPHCADVKKFLEENKIAEKVSFEEKEVWHDQKNAAEMTAKAKVCNLDPKQIGVPFIFADGKCYIGTPDVEDFFKSKAGI